MAIGYGTISQCLSRLSNNPYCWDPFLSGTFGTFGAGTFGFYAGPIIAVLGAIMLVGPDVVRVLRKLGAGSDSEQ